LGKSELAAGHLTVAGDVARADLELRSSPLDKRLVLKRLVYELASEPRATPPLFAAQLSFEV
jgi:DNA polymerase-3 subunit delta